MPPNSQDFLSRSCASREGFRLRRRRDLGSQGLPVPATPDSFSVHAVPTLITLCDGSTFDLAETAAEYAIGYRAAWANTRDRQRLYSGTSISGLAIPSPVEQEAHLLTAEIWAAVKMIDSALGAIELEVAWETGGPTPRALFDLAISAVDYCFLDPDHAYLALWAALPREWRRR